jgi:hypothetical protein
VISRFVDEQWFMRSDDDRSGRVLVNGQLEVEGQAEAVRRPR